MSKSILDNLKSLKKTEVGSGRTPMQPVEIEACRAALKRDNRGYNVLPNMFDIDRPYKVTINYNGEWNNVGTFTNADVAAAVGGILSLAYFGELAQVGKYDAAIAEAHPEFQEWLADDRNQEIIARATGKMPCIHVPAIAKATGTTNAF